MAHWRLIVGELKRILNGEANFALAA